MQLAGATQEETFKQYLREAVERATVEDIDRIFPPVTSDCQNCQKKICPCRFLRDAFGVNPDVYVCLECFEVGMQVIAAGLSGDRQSSAECLAIFYFLATGKTPPALEN